MHCDPLAWEASWPFCMRLGGIGPFAMGHIGVLLHVRHSIPSIQATQQIDLITKFIINYYGKTSFINCAKIASSTKYTTTAKVWLHGLYRTYLNYMKQRRYIVYETTPRLNLNIKVNCVAEIMCMTGFMFESSWELHRCFKYTNRSSAY